MTEAGQAGNPPSRDGSGAGRNSRPPPPADSSAPLAESLVAVPGIPIGTSGEGTVDIPVSVVRLMDASEVTSPAWPRPVEEAGPILAHAPQPVVALGETLQLVHYARRGDTLLISGITPHGRRLTFEQREDRQGWYVVAAGRRRRPTERELGLVVATITQEMEAALVPERQTEVRSAYRLAVASDLPGLPVQGLEAYRDILLDEAAAFTAGQTERLAVVEVSYQAFKRFANRHGHRVGAAFVQALGERLRDLFKDEEGVDVFHKSGKSFRLVIVNRSSEQIRALIDQITSDETREWVVHRVWGSENRTHPDEVHFHIGIASASRTSRTTDYTVVAQRLSDDAYRASKLGQLSGHTSIALAKSDYRTTVYRWNKASEDELQDLAAQMDDGPADVMAEMSDYLHELVPADLEGMAVAGDLDALVFSAIARDGFWQGTTAMRIVGERLVRRLLEDEPTPPEEHNHAGGFDLGDEFYGIAIEDGCLYFARGDINSTGATRVKAGLECVQRAVGWRRQDGEGIVGRFIGALADCDSGVPLVQRIRAAAQQAYEDNEAVPELHVNDAVDIADFLFTRSGEPVQAEHLEEGAELMLVLPHAKRRRVTVLERRAAFTLRLSIDGTEYPAVWSDSVTGPQVKLRIRRIVASAAVCILRIAKHELQDLLSQIREDNGLSDDAHMDVTGFLRHITDILLEDHVKLPSKIELALGAGYDAESFVSDYTLEDVREGHPGLFYEAIHQDLLEGQLADLDRQLCDLIGHTMLTSARPLR